MDRFERIKRLYEAEEEALEAASGASQTARGPSTAVLGVDLAAHSDHPAACVVTDEGDGTGWLLAAASRLPRIGDTTHWQSTAGTVGRLALGLLGSYNQVFVMVDGGGVGDAVAVQIKAELPEAELKSGRLVFHTVVTVAGDKVYGLIPGGTGRYSVGKERLMDTVAWALEQGVITRGPAVADELFRELSAVTRKDNGKVEARSGHDDIVAALALSLLVPSDRVRRPATVVHNPAAYGSRVASMPAGLRPYVRELQADVLEGRSGVDVLPVLGPGAKSSNHWGRRSRWDRTIV